MTPNPSIERTSREKPREVRSFQTLGFPMSLQELTIPTWLQRLLLSITSGSLTLVVWLLSDTPREAVLKAIAVLPVNLLVAYILGTTALLAMSLLLLAFIYLKNMQSLKLRYGIYWDKIKNPYCPKCKTPLVTRSKATPLADVFFCPCCDRPVSPHNEKLQTISREKALSLMSANT